MFVSMSWTTLIISKCLFVSLIFDRMGEDFVIFWSDVFSTINIQIPIIVFIVQNQALVGTAGKIFILSHKNTYSVVLLYFIYEYLAILFLK